MVIFTKIKHWVNSLHSSTAQIAEQIRDIGTVLSNHLAPDQWGQALALIYHRDFTGACVLFVFFVLVCIFIFWTTSKLLHTGIHINRRVKQGASIVKKKPGDIYVGYSDNSIKKITNQSTGKTKLLVPAGEAYIPREMEYSHIGIFGKTGTGKTQVFHQVLMALDDRRYINREDSRAIVLDTKPDFIDHYFREGDLIFNPMDARCMPWCLFKDISPNTKGMKADIQRIVSSLIPTKSGGGESAEWRQKARVFLAEIIEGLFLEDKNVSNYDLYYILSSKDIPRIYQLLKTYVPNSTYAGQCEVYQENSRNLLDDVLESITSNVVGILQALPSEANKETGVGLRDWVINGKKGQWLFLTRRLQDSDYLNQVYATIINMISQFQMSLHDNNAREISYVLDELPTAGLINGIADLLKVGRSKLASVVLGLQTYDDLKKTYGKDTATIILQNIGSLIAMRLGTDTAMALADNFGKARGRRVVSSYDNDNKKSRREENYQEHLVDPTQLQNLPKLTRNNPGIGLLRSDLQGDINNPYPKPHQLTITYQGDKIRQDATESFIEGGEEITWTHPEDLGTPIEEKHEETAGQKNEHIDKENNQEDTEEKEDTNTKANMTSVLHNLGQ